MDEPKKGSKLVCQECGDPLTADHGHNTLTKLMMGVLRKQWWVVLPKDEQCSSCGLWDVEHPSVRDALVAAGRDPETQARCRCAELAEKRRRQLSSESNLPYTASGKTARTLENYQPAAGTEKALAAVRSFIRNPDHGLVLVGGSGAGKAHLLEAVGRLASQ